MHPFSERARAVLQHSRDEAVRLGQDAVGTEHLLLGVLRAGGLPVRLLRDLGASAQQLRRAAEAAAPPPVGEPSELARDDLALTAAAEHALALAEREAAELGIDTVGAEWLLVGLMGEAEGVLRAALDPDAVRAEVRRFHGAEPDPAAPTVREPPTPYLRDRAANAARRLSIVFDAETQEADVVELLLLLSELYRALGGDGLVILDSGVPAWDAEDER